MLMSFVGAPDEGCIFPDAAARKHRGIASGDGGWRARTLIAAFSVVFVTGAGAKVEGRVLDPDIVENGYSAFPTGRCHGYMCTSFTNVRWKKTKWQRTDGCGAGGPETPNKIALAANGRRCDSQHPADPGVFVWRCPADNADGWLSWERQGVKTRSLKA
jgi:hypothetical protein